MVQRANPSGNPRTTNVSIPALTLAADDRKDYVPYGTPPGAADWRASARRVQSGTPLNRL
jgi:hypothetical protein